MIRGERSRHGFTTYILLAVALSLAGCVQGWTRPGGTERQFEIDRAACERAARVREVLLDEARFERCMEERGYRRR